MRRASGIIGLLGLCITVLQAQDRPAPPALAPVENVPSIFSFYAPLFFPKLFQDTYCLKDYIRSPEFVDFRWKYGDLYAVDEIFDHALKLSWNNIYEALVITALATFDHRNVGVKLPILGALFWVPLTSEFQGEFTARLRALPTRLYPDSPNNRAGDRDKLQHFFGSAFLTYVCESAGAAERVGDFIEWGEERFIVGGVNDERDVRSNRQGQRFGLCLLEDSSARPSDFFILDIPGKAREVHPPCGLDRIPDSLDLVLEGR